jgi:hypothetical protein
MKDEPEKTQSEEQAQGLIHPSSFLPGVGLGMSDHPGRLAPG